MKRLLLAILLLLPISASAQFNGCSAGFCAPAQVASGHAMVTPLFVDPSNVPSTTATNFTGIQGGTFNASSTGRQTPISTAGAIANLNVRFPTATGAGLTYDICLVLNGSSTCSALTCQVTNSALTCSDATHSVSVVAGDLLAWKVVPTGTPASQTSTEISATFTSTANGESIVLLSNVGGTSNTSAFYQNFGFQNINSWTATEANASSIVPTAGTLDKLYINTNAGPGAAKTIVFSVFKNGTNTGLTCTTTGSGTGAGVSTCNDTTHSVSVIASDLISLEMCPGTVAGGTCTALSTANVGNIMASLRWVPSTPGEAIVMAVQPVQANSATRFFPFGGGASASSESAEPNISPSAFTAKSLYVAVNAAPGGSASRAVTMRKGTGGGQSDQALTCTLTSAVISCNDTTHTVSVSLSDLINWSTVPASTPAAITYLKDSVVAYTP